MRLHKLFFIGTLVAMSTGAAFAGQHGGHGGGHGMGHGHHGGGMHFAGGYGMHGHGMYGHGGGYNMNGYGYGGGGYEEGYGNQVIVIENGYELLPPPPPPPYGYRMRYRGVRYAYPAYGNCCPCGY